MINSGRKKKLNLEVAVSVTQSTTTAPIVKIAAGAVIILCTVGVAAMTGLIPGVSSQEKAAETAETPVTPTSTKTANEPVKQAQTKPVVRERVRVAAAAPACVDCGVVQSVQAVEVAGQASGAGAVVGGVAGLVVGNQIGDGRGKKLAKIAGAAGGAYAGHQIEKNMKKTVEYHVSVRMNDGSYRTIVQPTDEGLIAGARVKVIGNSIVRDAS